VDTLPDYPAPPLALTGTRPDKFRCSARSRSLRGTGQGDRRTGGVRNPAVFTEETEIRMNLLRKLSLDRDLTGIGREAHSLKSSAGTFGYRELASLAEELELGARSLADGEYRELLDRMDAAYSSARAQELQALKRPPRTAAGATVLLRLQFS